jgi:hypothetical protein
MPRRRGRASPEVFWVDEAEAPDKFARRAPLSIRTPSLRAARLHRGAGASAPQSCGLSSGHRIAVDRILQDDDAAFVGSRLLGGQVQRAVDGLEHRPTGAKHDRIDEQMELVDQAGPEQGAGEAGPAIGDESLPCSAFRRVTSSASLPLARSVFGHLDWSSVLEKKTFRILVIGWANAPRWSAGSTLA